MNLVATVHLEHTHTGQHKLVKTGTIGSTDNYKKEKVSNEMEDHLLSINSIIT